MEGLTEKQLSILAYVKSYTKKNGYQPTRIEIGKASKKPVSGVAITNQMEAIEKKGYIERIDRRAIKFTAKFTKEFE